MPNIIAFALGFMTFPAICVATIAILNYGVVPPNEAREAEQRQDGKGKQPRHVSTV